MYIVGHMTLSRCLSSAGCLITLAILPLVTAQKESINRVIQQLQEGRPVIGTFARSPRPGLDFAVIDEQYGDFDIDRVRDAIAGFRQGGEAFTTAPIVRTPLAVRDAPQEVVAQLVDAGVYGLMFPDVETKAQALAAITSMRNGPDDVWPLNPNGKLLAMIQIESPTGINNLDQILEVPGIGVIFLGPTDIATAIGAEGPNSPRVELLVQEVLQVCLRENIACGYPIVAASPIDAERETARRLAEGFKVLAVMTRAQ